MCVDLKRTLVLVHLTFADSRIASGYSCVKHPDAVQKFEVLLDGSSSALKNENVLFHDAEQSGKLRIGLESAHQAVGRSSTVVFFFIISHSYSTPF
jgi:hypothetical protein